jgi:hypothetical protein
MIVLSLSISFGSFGKRNEFFNFFVVAEIFSSSFSCQSGPSIKKVFSPRRGDVMVLANQLRRGPRKFFSVKVADDFF